MIEHNQPITGKFRVLTFDPGVVLSKWSWKDRNRREVAEDDWEWNEKERLVLPKRFRPSDDTGWRGNLVVSTGKDIYQNQTFGITATAVDRTGVGDSAVAPAPGQTGLQGGSTFFQIFDALPTLLAFVISAQSTVPGGSTAFQWNEAGCFAGPGNGPTNMLNRIIGFGSPTPGGAAAIAAWSITQN